MTSGIATAWWRSLNIHHLICIKGTHSDGRDRAGCAAAANGAAGFRPLTYERWPRQCRTVGSRLCEDALVLQVEAGEPVPIQEHDLALAMAGEPEDTQTVKPR
jgi:hypothetical protein